MNPTPPPEGGMATAATCAALVTGGHLGRWWSLAIQHAVRHALVDGRRLFHLEDAIRAGNAVGPGPGRLTVPMPPPDGPRPDRLDPTTKRTAETIYRVVGPQTHLEPVLVFLQLVLAREVSDTPLALDAQRRLRRLGFSVLVLNPDDKKDGF